MICCLISGVYLIGMVIYRKELLSMAVNNSLNNCVSIIHDALKKFEPDVIVGSSWGGTIAVELIKMNIWNGKTVLLAPAYLRVMKIIYNGDIRKINELSESELRKLLDLDVIDSHPKWIIIHSKIDKSVKYVDSQLLVKYNESHFDMISIDKDCHSLTRTLRSGELNRIIRNYIKS